MVLRVVNSLVMGRHHQVALHPSRVDTLRPPGVALRVVAIRTPPATEDRRMAPDQVLSTVSMLNLGLNPDQGAVTAAAAPPRAIRVSQVRPMVGQRLLAQASTLTAAKPVQGVRPCLLRQRPRTRVRRPEHHPPRVIRRPANRATSRVTNQATNLPINLAIKLALATHRPLRSRHPSKGRGNLLLRRPQAPLHRARFLPRIKLRPVAHRPRRAPLLANHLRTARPRLRTPRRPRQALAPALVRVTRILNTPSTTATTVSTIRTPATNRILRPLALVRATNIRDRHRLRCHPQGLKDHPRLKAHSVLMSKAGFLGISPHLSKRRMFCLN